MHNYYIPLTIVEVKLHSTAVEFRWVLPLEKLYSINQALSGCAIEECHKIFYENFHA